MELALEHAAGPYRIPHTRIEALAITTIEETGPFGSKGIGEVGINGPLPAIAGAIEQALEVRMHQAPFTPPRVLAALEAHTGSRGDAA